MRTFNIKVNGKAYAVEVEEVVSGGAVVTPVVSSVAAAPVAAAPAPAAAGEGAPVKCEMPGLVKKLSYSNGASVKKGDTILILEAMKMDTPIAATQDGVITYAVQPGANVNTGDVLCTIAYGFGGKMATFFTTVPSNLLVDSLKNLWNSTGFMTSLTPIWQNLIMLVIAGVLIYLAVAKEFEPNLLLAIGFGMFIINIPGAYNILYGTLGYSVSFTGTQAQIEALISAGIMNDNGQLLFHGVSLGNNMTLNQLVDLVNSTLPEAEQIGTHLSYMARYELVEEHILQYLTESIGALQLDINTAKALSFGHQVVKDQGLFFYLYKGVEWVIYPPLIFLGIGDDRLRSVDRQPQELDHGRGGAAGYFRDLPDRDQYRFYRRRSGGARYHRRRGRSDGDLRDDQTRGASVAGDRGCGVFVHGVD